MAREFTDILSSGEVTEIFLGGTDPGDEVLTSDEIITLLSSGVATSVFIGGTDPGDEVLTSDEIETLLSGGSLTSIFIGGVAAGNEVLTSDEIAALLSGGSLTSIFIGGTGAGDEVLTSDEITALLPGGSTDIHFDDTGVAYFGSSDDMSIYHNGSNGFITNGTGGLVINTTSAAYLYLGTNSTTRWYLDNSGHLLPNADLTYDIGNSSLGVKDIYVGLAGHVYLGGDTNNYVYSAAASLELHGNAVIHCEATSYILFTTAAGYVWQMDTSGNLIPWTDATYSLGDATHCASYVYYYNLSSCSDERLKEDIQDSLGLDFINRISAVSYKYNSRVESKKPKRKRQGLLAQQIKSVVDELSEDFEGIHYDEENDKYGLDYTQFIAPIIKAIQELKEIVDDHTEMLGDFSLSKPDNK